MRPSPRKLFWKLGLTYIGLLALALVPLFFYAGQVVEENFMRLTVGQLESLVRLAESRPPDLGDPAALAEWTRWLSRSGSRITIIASDGKVLADSAEDPSNMENHANRPEVREAFSNGRGAANRYSDTVKRDLVYLAVRYHWGNEPPVVLRIAEPLVRIEEAVADVRRPLGMVSIGLLLVGGVAAFFFSRVISTRVAKLRELSKRVAEGDFTPMPVDGGGDELTELAASLNDTAVRLDSSIRSLREERNQSATILSSMSEGVAVVGHDGRILYLNRAFRRSLGLGGETWEEFRGKSFSEVVSVPELVGLAAEALERNQRSEIEIAVGRAPQRLLLARIAPVSEVKKSGAVVVLLDVTEIHRLERVRRDFVANVSHELKTPLTAIQGFAETLLGGALEDPKHSQRFLEIIREHAMRLGRLTDDLLKLSRIEAGKHEPQLHLVRVPSLVGSVVETSRFKAEPRNISLTVAIPEDIPPIESDADWLAEVLQNLIDNAIQYTSSGGAIRVWASTGEDEVSIGVTDNGIGIPLESQGRIFERFYRVDAARSREVGGTGLGLAIAKHLVESLGGRIELESEAGKGSTFTIVLPRQPQLHPRPVSVA